jgi:predicted DNA-binding transcriptional regulator AlpA
VTAAPEPHLLTTAQVADLLQVSQNTLRGWRHTKQGPPSITLVGVVRYDRDALLAWIDAQRSEPTSARPRRLRTA